jgi:alkanesulfonate monooxygenase SsuD/methylene tetrahydromethanopterin reductase-like flavin-dependent oxidoreductase (luciferase family)
MPFDGDLLTALAVALREVNTIEVGSAVLPIQNQHPMLLAQRALTLNRIAGGRFLLGLGMTHQAVTQGMWGSRTTSRYAACARQAHGRHADVAAAEAGRPDGAVRVVAGLPISVTDDVDGASATRKRCQSGSTSLPGWASTRSPRWSSTHRLTCGNAPAHCCCRWTPDAENYPWCDHGRRRTVDRTTGSGVTIPKSRPEVKADRARLM